MLSNSDVQRAYTAGDFAACGASQATLNGAVTAARRVSVSGVQVTDDGATYVAATYSVDLQMPSGLPRTSTWDVYFIRQSSGWAIWSSVQR